MTDSSNANLRNPAAIVFTSATTYTIDGGPPQTYTPGQTISANGWSFVLDGAPKVGDTFNITPTPAGSSDNSNASGLAKVESAKAFNAGTVTLNGALGGLTTQVGAAARSAEYSLEAQLVINDKAQEARDEVSGVNLDEEAADMLRLQQAYQAASQLISTADSMFQTIPEPSADEQPHLHQHDVQPVGVADDGQAGQAQPPGAADRHRQQDRLRKGRSGRGRRSGRTGPQPAALERMKLNAGNVQNRLGVQENTLAQVNDLMGRVNDLTIRPATPP